MLQNLLKTGFWAYIIFLTVSLLMPVPQTGEVNHMDKVIHVGVFVLAGISMTWAYGTDKKLFNYLLTYGIAIECAQGLTGYRSFDVLDLLANAGGLLLSRLLILMKTGNQEISDAN
ncbi:MAG: hypothetical protein MK132_04120 [Lentisphaerales bacterium]|nr:hypothetical protein [Lentisphaerales bacterium]